MIIGPPEAPYSIQIWGCTRIRHVIFTFGEYREPSHRGVCAQNLQTRGLKNGDDVTLVPIFYAGHVGMYQINLF